MLVQLEMEIDEEIKADKLSATPEKGTSPETLEKGSGDDCGGTPEEDLGDDCGGTAEEDLAPPARRRPAIVVDMMSLDEMVSHCQIKMLIALSF